MGGGGDDGYSARQAQLEADKQRARDALNAMFGVAPTGGQRGTAPTRAQFTTTLPGAQSGGGNGWDWSPQQDAGGGTRFDQAGFDAATRAWGQQGGQDAAAAANKSARDALYQGVRDNAFTAGKRGFDEMRGRAARDLKFSLFAQGLNGGSVDVDENALLGRTYDKGLLDLGAKADAAKADFAGSDEQTRLGLLQSIDAGMDQGSALSSALSQMRVNSDRATAAAQGTSVGDLFADAGLLYTKSNAARGRQAADDAFSANYPQFRNLFSKGGGGIITRTS